MPEQPQRAGKRRLDQALAELGLCESREKAKRAILSGQVNVNGQKVDKASHMVLATDTVTLAAPEKFVSRGGHKLEHALLHFQLRVQGLIALDVGASTGGFTDCLLQHGATQVYAVDVGRGQLAWKLRQDPRVVVMEKINARQLTPGHFPPGFAPVDFVSIDCSFISLRQILPPLVPLLKPGGLMVALVKPQFEAGKAEVDKGEGVITDPKIHQQVIETIRAFVDNHGQLTWRGVVESPLLGPAGNKEFLALLEKQP